LVDPLTQIVGLLQPSASVSKLVTAAGPWRLHRTEAGQPYYCVILDGSCRLAVRGHAPITLETGDFVLIPSAFDFTKSSPEPDLPEGLVTMPVQVRPSVFHLGTTRRAADVRMVVGYCAFGSTDATLLVSLLPQLVHVRGEDRLAALAQLVAEEAHASRPGRDVILSRLLEVLLIEALRSTTGPDMPPGLLKGLADERLAVALRRMHEHPTRPWTVAHLAKEAAFSRSAFFDRFKRSVGVAPMEYLLRWRMALAKNLLRRKEGSVAEIAERVGYSSASTFSIAFSRHVGQPPAQYSRGQTVLEFHRAEIAQL
jgi:AraC-like DNA-binding protein